MLTHSIKTIAKKAGFTISRNNFGLDQWDDTVTILGRNPELIFDVGANIGQTALNLVKRFPDSLIHSFEPFPKSFATLQRAVARHPTVTARNLGFGAEERRQDLYVHPGSEWNSMLRVSKEIGETPDSKGWTVNHAASTVDVQIATVDGYCGEHKIGAIDVLKIDTQGYELRVLQGARQMLAKKAIRIVFMEMNVIAMYDGQAPFEELYSYMKESGYRLSGLYDRAFDREHAIMWCDGLFVA